MNPLTETFPLACLVFGILCAVVSLVADHRERKRLNQLAIIKRITFDEDKRPLQYLENSYPWRHASWFGLNGVESSRRDAERSTRRSS